LTGVPGQRVRVLRVIARMNVGGPAYHVSLLSGRLDPERFETLLVAGSLGSGEGSFEGLARRYGADLRTLPSLGPEVSPLRDLRALGALVRIIRRTRPDVVHTHTAKAGTLGRLAAVLAGRPRPVIVHTFHGHVLTGYFGPALTAFYRAVERALARVSDRLIGVSDATVDELVQLGVAPRERFEVVRLGLDLDGFLGSTAADGDGFRDEVGAGPGTVLAVSVGRLVPIKRLDVMLRALAIAREAGAPILLAIAGDGDEREGLERLAREIGVGSWVRFLGFRHDLTRIAAGADLAVLSSDNEGTPVALIEAAAAGRPAVATDVGGVREIVGPDTGRLVPKGDAAAFAAAMVELAGDRGLRERLGAAARERARGRFAAGRLLADVEALYGRLLAERA
jgi:glycosyltransferase involved in cell wall biosynthesis